MNGTNIKYIPLTFISSLEEKKTQVANTLIMKHIVEHFGDIRTLSVLLNSTQYGYTASAQESGTHKFIRITDIQGGSVDWLNTPYCNCDKPEKYLVKAGDILIARTGGTTGKSFLIRDNVPTNAVFASYLIKLSANENILPEYLYMFLNSYAYWSQISEMKSGSAQPNVNAKKLSLLQIPYCNLKTQKSVVDTLFHNRENCELDRLKAQIERAVSKVDILDEIDLRIDRQMKLVSRYRGSVISEAVQGTLVQQDLTDESAMEQIRGIRTEKEQLVKEKKIKREKPLPSITPKDVLYELPPGWEWVRLGEISESVDYGTSVKASSEPNGIAVLRMNNIQDGKVVFDDLKYVPPHIEELPRLYLENRDILFNRTNSYELVGKSAVYFGDAERFTFASYLIRVRLIRDQVLPTYVHAFLNSSVCRDQMEPHITQQNGQANFNGTKLQRLMIPLPPLSEQARVMERLDRILGMCEEVVAQFRASGEQRHTYLQSVLNEMFQLSTQP